jgi:hypothetical protein
MEKLNPPELEGRITGNVHTHDAESGPSPNDMDPLLFVHQAVWQANGYQSGGADGSVQDLPGPFYVVTPTKIYRYNPAQKKIWELVDD